MFIHVFDDTNSPVEQLITWVPAHWMAKRGCPSTTLYEHTAEGFRAEALYKDLQ